MINRISTRLPRLLLALLLVPVGAGAVEYTVVDSGAVLAEFPAIQWMDEHRVIFLGVSGEYCKRDAKPDSYRKPLPRIAVFDTRTGQLSWHGEVGVARLCYADGNVSYARQIVEDGGLCPSDKWEFLRGRFGKEKVQSDVPISENCQPEAEGAVEARKAWVAKIEAREKERNKQWLRMVRLREEHGWLAIRDGGFSAPPYRPTHPIAIYLPGQEDKPIPIDKTLFEPWLKEGYAIGFRRYVPFKQAYLLALEDRSGSGREYAALWWLYPNGRLESMLQHRRENGWEHFFYFGMVPTKTGLLAVGGHTKSINDKSGVYRRGRDGQPEIVDRGWVYRGGFTDDHPLSPDGCRLAYGIHPKGFGNWPATYHLRVIDVCLGGNP